MRTQSSEAGFSLMEVLFATTISLIVIGAAMTTFKDAMGLTSTASNLADASLNLRGGTNLLIRDLQVAGRLIPIGGIPIPSGANAGHVNRPSPPGYAYTFDAVSDTTLSAITTGAQLGPVIDNRPTDMITMLTLDPLLEEVLAPAGSPPGTVATLNVWVPKSGKTIPASANGSIAADGSWFGLNDASKVWIAGDPNNGVAPLNKGDLLLFGNSNGQYAIQTVTSTTSTQVYFASNSDDPFSFNQRNAAAGSITQILIQNTTLTVQRVRMYTYYVDPSNGTPRLMRQYNFTTPQALAGVVEDLDLSYDIVDGSVNPTAVNDLPYTLNGTTYSANQIRKVNVHVGVRSEAMALKQHDYLRSHISTVVSLRQLSYVDRYK